jgi:hypothetical protein
VVIELETDVLQSYNQYTDLRANSNNPKVKLTANDFYHMARRLMALAKQIQKFKNGEFKTADEIIAFVNANLVDPSALGVATKYIINYPF